VNLTQCPYDGAQIEVEFSDRGSLLLTCVVCDAVWEHHGAWTGRVRGPDRDKLAAAQRQAPTAPAGELLPTVQADFDVI
jgi:hypothetical protein